MQLIFITCAESTALDARRNSISLFHVLEELAVTNLPAVVPQMCVALIFTREADEPAEPDNVEMRITLNDRELYRGPVEVRFGQHLRFRALHDLRGMVINAPGQLKFAVLMNQQDLGSWFIVINHIGQPVVQTQLPLSDDHTANAPETGRR
jgi:hypothetical protein